jgi:hypothetical protein
MKLNFLPQLQYFATSTGAPTPQDVKNAQDLLDTVTTLQDAFQSISVIIGQQINKNMATTEDFTKKYAQTLKNDITKSLNQMGKNSEDIVKNNELLSKGQSKSKDIQKQITDLGLKQKLLSKDLNIIQNNGLLTAEERTKQEDEIAIKIAEQNAELTTQLSRAKEIEQNFGAIGALVEGAGKFLQRWGIDSGVAVRMTEKLQEAAAKGKVGFKDLAKVIKEELTDALQDPLVAFTIGLKAAQSGFNDIKKAFDIFKEYNAIFVDTARNLGMVTDQVTRMVEQSKFANTSFEATVYTTKQLTKAMTDMNGQLGLSVDFGASATTEFAAMTNQMGLSAEEASKIQGLGLLNNATLKDTNKAIADGIVAAQKSTGVQVNAKQIFQEIGKLSAGITAKFQQNPEALAKAVVQAKALGTSLEQMDKVGESLLNWESSIQNELEAELLTGRQINVEKARYAALTGDQVTLMNEVTSQVGSLTDFQNMNVLAQGSLAKAFGMSRDEMADMLQKQEVFNKLGDVSGKSAAEQLAIAKEKGISESDSLVVNLQQQATAEKLEATFDSLKETVASLLSGPFSGLVDTFKYLAEHAWMIRTAIFLMSTISLAKTIGGLATMAVQLGIASASAMATAAAITLGIGIGAVLIGLATMSSAADDAAKKATASVPKSAGDIISPADGKTQVSTKEGGLFELSKNDDLLAGPGLAKKGNSSDTLAPKGMSIDMSPMVAAINEVKVAIDRLYSKDTSINLDGRKVGAGLVQTSYKLA